MRRRRRRRHLQVSTFPFMAVLLCAMGSLILLLLVLDRQAKLAAQAKAKEATELSAKEAEKERASLIAEREAEWKRRTQELHLRLVEEEKVLLQQLNRVRAKDVHVQHEIAAQQNQNQVLNNKLRNERARLSQLKNELKDQQLLFVASQTQREKAERDLSQLQSELEDLEQTLTQMNKLRAVQERTYSVVPFKGQRGENRKPYYLECVSGGVVFHPERLSLQGATFTPLEIRKELQQRIKSRQAQANPVDEEKNPYLFLLVRPNGLKSFYAVRSAIAGMDIDFGYELIDQDWLLDFSQEEKIGSSNTIVASVKPSPPEGTGKAVKGFKNPGSATGKDASKERVGVSEGPLLTPPIWRPVSQGEVKSQNNTKLAAKTGSTVPEKMPPLNKLNDKGPHGTASHKTQSADPAKGGKKVRATGSRVTGNRDWYIAVQCNAENATLPLTRQEFSLGELEATPSGEHPLRQAVRAIIAKRQARVRPGDPPYRPILRFEVPLSGIRAYLLAYSVLEDLQLPMLRHNIQPKPPSLEDFYRK